MDEIEAGPGVEAHEPPVEHALSRGARAIIWSVLVVSFAVWTATARLHTHLGVKAPAWDKDGRDYVWRIWWRARDEIIERDSSAFVLLYVSLIVAFAVLSAYALWIALVPDDPALSQTSDQ